MQKLIFLALAGLNLVGAATAGEPRIAVLLKGDTAFWHEVQAGVEAAAKKDGVELTIKAPPTEDSTSIQIRMVTALAANPPQVLVISADDHKALAAPVAALAAKGVKIIAVDSPLDGAEVHTFVGTDHHAAGAAAAQVLAGVLHANESVAIFRASETLSGGATEDRENAAIAALKSADPSLALHGEFRSGGNPEVAVERATALLEKYPSLHAVLASSTVGSMAMLQALEQSKRAGAVRFVGFGYNLPRVIEQAIAAGKVTAWIAQLPRAVGAKSIAVAVALAAGKDVPPVVYEDFLVVTKENLHQPEVAALISD